MTPWITKPVPFNIGQGAAAAEAAGCGITYDETGRDAAQDLDGSIRNYSLKMLDGFEFIGCKIATAKFKVAAGSATIPAGDMYATLYSSAGVVKTTSDAINMDTLNEDFQLIPFIFSAPTTIAINDFISFTADYDAAPGFANGWIKCGRDSRGAPVTVELWIGGVDSPDDIAQESSTRQPTMELIST